MKLLEMPSPTVATWYIPWITPCSRFISPESMVMLLTQLCRTVKPEILLIGATPLGRDLSSVVATQLQTGLTADCTGLDIDPNEKLLLMTRPTFGGNIMATILCRNHRPQMSTVRPKVMKMPKKDPAIKVRFVPVKYEGFAEIVPRIIRDHYH